MKHQHANYHELRKLYKKPVKDHIDDFIWSGWFPLSVLAILLTVCFILGD